MRAFRPCRIHRDVGDCQARAARSIWRNSHNSKRPRSGLGWQTPSEFSQTFTPKQGSALRDMLCPAPVPVAQLAHQGKPNRQSKLKTEQNLGASSKRMVLANLRLVVSIANPYRGKSSLDVPDLVQ